MNPEKELFEPIVEQCLGCGRITDTNHCAIYTQPSHQWTRIMGCATRTHNKTIQFEDAKQLNPLKASKRSVRGGKK